MGIILQQIKNKDYIKIDQLSMMFSLVVNFWKKFALQLLKE